MSGPVFLTEEIPTTFVTDDGDTIVASEERTTLFEVGLQGPPGRDGADAPSIFSAQNKDSVSAQPGQPVAIHSSGTGFVLAEAADNARPTVGLAVSAIAPGFSGPIQTEGMFTLADWTAVTGTVSLAAKASYFLDVVAGKLTTAAPSAPGQAWQPVGTAVSPTTLDLNILFPPVLL